MKSKLFTTLTLLCLGVTSLAQVGIGTSTPNESAALDVESTTKGILFPRMTEAQRGDITPVAGLTVYCTDCGAEGKGELQTYNGSSWIGHNDFVPASGGTFSGEVKFDGNVGIGTDNPQAKFHLKDSNHAQMQIETTDINDKVAGITYIAGDNIWKVGAGYGLDQSNFSFYDYKVQKVRMAIDYSGNILVGKTSTGDANGVQLEPAGAISINRDNSIPLYLNRKSSDGTIVEFRKDGTTVGSIGTDSGDLTFGSGVQSQERMRIDANGNVGIGTDTPQVNLHIEGTDKVSQYIRSIGHNILEMGTDKNSGFIISRSSKPLFFGTSNTERMRIDREGNFLVGTTNQNLFSEAGFRVLKPGQTGQSVTITNTSLTNSDEVLLISRQAEVTEGEAIQFYRAGTIVGSITLSSGSTAYNTTSDYRLKENVQPIINASNRLMELKPVNFAWKVDGSRIDGFLAHEVDEVVPNAVSGDKDAIDEEGNPEYQSLDHSKLVPLLTAALQDALVRIEALEQQLKNQK